MKARRKSDGQIIEVKEWRGASDVIYSSPDMNHFYQASDLDFNVDAEDTVIQGWVARDQDGYISIFTSKPERDTCDKGDMPYGFWDDNTDQHIELPITSFPDLTWESDPLQVEIIIKRKKK